MKSFNTQRAGLVAGALILAAATVSGLAEHVLGNHLVDGLRGPNFTLAAKDGHLSTGEGNSVYFWGYANGTAGKAQYSGPTLIVNEGDDVSVTFVNFLPQTPVSIVFPGQSNVIATGGSPGLLTSEAAAATKAADGTITPSAAVVYTFKANKPGTYLYQSGTRPDLQIEMGLVGALIVRPAGFSSADPTTWKAYNQAESAFNDEYLFFITEMDAKIHEAVELGNLDVDMTKWWPVYWFLNGRTGPDTMLPPAPGAAWLPHQPYDCWPSFHPGDKILMRVVGAGRDPHPFHHHGNHSLVIAKDGRPLSSTPGGPIDLAYQVFTIPTTPGGTTDALFQWTAKGLGWDIYGHSAAQVANDDIDAPPTGNFPTAADGDVDRNGNGIFETSLQPFEDPADHGKPIPVKLPSDQQMTFGQFYGGSPFIGAAGTLPPGEGGFNPGGGLMFMWHSHSEKELCNYDVFPGGMLTMALIQAHAVH